MNKSLIALLVVFLLCGTTEAGIEVFYLPESGFLRVSGQVVIEPEAASLSLFIFPNAAVTEFWADELVSYSVQRYEHGTEVVFSIREVKPQTVTFSYEGLVEPQPQEAVLGRDQLWLPQFSAPVQELTVTLQLPAAWEVHFGSVQTVQEQGSYRLIQLAAGSTYPTLELVNTALPAAELAQEERAELQAPEDELPETPPQAEPEEERSPEAEDEAADSLPAALMARIQIQINRFVRALNGRSAAELAELIGPELQEKGLTAYLASLPEYYGRITSLIEELPADPQGIFQVVLSTERGPRYAAAMAWQESEGALLLSYFHLTPYAADVPREVAASCEFFVDELLSALRAANETKLETLLAPDLVQERTAVVDFLLTLDSGSDWEIAQISVDPFAVAVRAPSAKGENLLLKLDLTPGQYHWLLRGLQVVPLP